MADAVSATAVPGSQRSGRTSLTVLEAGRRGAEITDYVIDYTTEGQEYSLEVDWQLVACGTETSADMCR